MIHTVVFVTVCVEGWKTKERRHSILDLIASLILHSSTEPVPSRALAHEFEVDQKGDVHLCCILFVRCSCNVASIIRTAHWKISHIHSFHH